MSLCPRQHFYLGLYSIILSGTKGPFLSKGRSCYLAFYEVPTIHDFFIIILVTIQKSYAIDFNLLIGDLRNETQQV